MQKKSVNNSIFVGVAVIAMLAGIWLGSHKEQKNLQQIAKIQGVILPEAKTIRPFALTSHQQGAFTLDSLKDHWSIIFVGYTQCPDVCPAALSVLKQMHRLMTEQSIKVPEVVFVSIDPQRDTYQSLAEYVHYFNADFIGVTGELDQLKYFTQQLSASFMKASGPSGDMNNDDYLMDHSSSFMLINPQAKLQSFLTAPHNPVQLIDSIRSSQDYYNNNK